MVKEWKQWHTLFSWAPKSLWTLPGFSNFLQISWMQYFNSIIIRIWSSSAGIPSPPLRPTWLHIPGCPALGDVSVASISFLSFIVSIFCMKWYLGIFLIFFKRSCLFHSIPFLYFFALFTSEAFLISLCCSLELCIQIGLSFLFFFFLCLSHLLFSQL